MILFICRTCGKFRDVTPITFFCHPEYFLTDEKARFIQYNHTVTHCPNGHGEMYQVQKGDRLQVLPAEIEPLTIYQKKLIALYLKGQCSDGYLMTNLKVSRWKDAEKLIEQYKREEGKNE